VCQLRNAVQILTCLSHLSHEKLDTEKGEFRLPYLKPHRQDLGNDN
jgi:hypothetical protein